MVPNIENYTGREQSWVKHYFLESYLDALLHKIASRFDHVVYVDGFSGPWQAVDEKFEDTSFSIALTKLRSAKEAWKKLGRDVQMAAHLVEKSRSAFQKLETVKARFPDINIVSHHGDFISYIPDLVKLIPCRAFMFLFIDPKGWRINLADIAPLLKRPNCEVVFNFMFDFINRAASMTDPRIVAALNELIPLGHWREALTVGGEEGRRKRILVDAFSSSLRGVGAFNFVAETPILHRIKDRTLYSLIYGTRRAPGIEVFRDCQIKTLRAQSAVRGTTKLANESTKTGQGELLGGFSDMAPDDTEPFLQEQAIAARRALLTLTPLFPANLRYGDLWPRILERYSVRKTELNQMAADAHRSGQIEFPNWTARKRVPDDYYEMYRRP